MSEILVTMQNIQKLFPGVHALDDVSLEIRAGEVLGLVGENGAGKSTLMKILCGIYTKDSGTITVCGSEVDINSPKRAQDLGINIIHQELNLMKDLSVAANIYIGREPLKGIVLDKKKQNKMARELLASLNIDIDPETPMKMLTVAKQQMVEIAKALSHEHTRVLIMDEPTAPLTDTEINELFRFIRELKQRNVGIVYISHRMDELAQITDRITVMRDGHYVDTVATSEVTIDDIISMMVGRVIYEHHAETAIRHDAPVTLEVKGLSSIDIDDVSFTLRKGEILGFAGLIGAGRTETARLLFGADPKDAGEIIINGQPVRIDSPYDAVRCGIGYLSEDRKQFGVCIGLSVADNSVMASLENYCGKMVLDKGGIRSVAEEYIQKINIKTPTVDQLVKNLSGGNQQKVVVAKWLIRSCDILIFDEPTRGIDVGAKNEIYKLMRSLAEEGRSIIMISSEMPELFRMSDRIVVMCEGRITGVEDIKDASQESIMRLATMRMK